MASQVNPPRGMRDMLPADKRHRENVASTIRRAFARSGFAEIETPVLETSDRLHSGLGGDNEKLAFAVLRRGLDLDEVRTAESIEDLSDLGLRFDLTVPLARFFASNQSSLPTVFRSMQLAPVWRAERPQRGRYRQFIQCDVDVIGESSIQAEIELIDAALRALDDLGLRKAVIRINDRRALDAVLARAGITPETRGRALITIDKRDKIGTEGVSQELAALVGEQSAREVMISLHRMSLTSLSPTDLFSSFDDSSARDVAQDLTTLTRVFGSRVEHDPYLVRGMGYYTGPIFEIAYPGLPYSIGGGGRYDGMIGRFAKADVPAAGISLGFERLLDLVYTDEVPRPQILAVVQSRGVDARDLIRHKRSLETGWGELMVLKEAKNMRRVLADAYRDGATHIQYLRPDGASDVQPLRAADPTP